MPSPEDGMVLLRRQIRLFASVVGLVLVTTVASAQPQAAPTPLADSISGPTKAEYDAGFVLFNTKDFAGARLKFERAYQLTPDPRLLWNIAVCEKELRRYHKVKSLVERYLKDGEAAKLLTDQQKEAALHILADVKPYVGTLEITTNVVGANAYVDGEYIGQTPITVPVPVSTGERKIRLTKPGYRDTERDLEVVGGDIIRKQIVMEAIQARLIIIAGRDDSLQVDGKPVGRGRWDSNIEPGPHSITVHAPNMKSFESQVDLTAGSTRTIQVKLEKDSSAWPWIVGGTFVLIGASVGGYFILKPSDKGKSSDVHGEVEPVGIKF